MAMAVRGINVHWLMHTFGPSVVSLIHSLSDDDAPKQLTERSFSPLEVAIARLAGMGSDQVPVGDFNTGAYFRLWLDPESRLLRH